MTIRFTNTLGHEKVDFEPLQPGRVSIYVCGPTVYDRTHVGHARPAITFDILRRHLAWRGYEVLFVRNITDVDDKIINKANESGQSWAQVAHTFTRVYDDAMDRLRVSPPDIAPIASAHIPEMIELIATLIDQGFAYPGEGSVYYSVEKFDGYGKLSGRGLDELANKERVEPAPGKHHPLDFALWKGAKPGEPFWNSPWGPGRPGWHIECSAMSAKYLGQPFDIHGGGADLIFPHHENEIAQSEAAHHVDFARYWLHNGHLNIRGEKMSKSLKNFVDVHELLAEYPVDVVRIFFASAHYRSQMDHTQEALEAARSVWERFQSFLRSVTASDDPVDDSLLAGFGEAMDDDLNTPGALAALHALVTEGHAASEAGDVDRASAIRGAVVRGLRILGCQESSASGSDLVGPLVEILLQQRQRARAAKNFERADEIRNSLTEIGVVVEDSPDGPRWFIE